MQKVTVSAAAHTDTKTEVSLRQRFSPTMISGLEMLAMSASSLTEHLTKIVEQNPLLDYDYDEAFISFSELPSEDAKEPSSSEDVYEPAYEDFSFSPLSTTKQSYDQNRLKDDCLETETLRNDLRLQMTRFVYSPQEQLLVDEIIDCIDENGYFASLLSVLASRHAIDITEVERLLADVQTCFPRGVAARNLGECLMLQTAGFEDYADTLATLLTDDLEDLAYNRLAKLQKKYHLPKKLLIDLKESISTLNPRPGAVYYQQSKTAYIIPDLVFKNTSPGFSVEVAGEAASTITINSDYMELLEKGTLGESDAKWLLEKQTEAQEVLRNVQQRKRTLYRLGMFLVESQYDFFCFGEKHIRPLVMKQVADALEVNESTVSRATHNKFALTPWGVFPLKFFFNTAFTSAQTKGAATVSSLSIKIRIKELVASEERAKPLSDIELTEILNAEGIEIKRRTVAKYRDSLGILKQSQRKSWPKE